MEKRWFYILIICGLATALFFTSNHFLRGYLGSQVSLAKEIKSPRDSIDHYNLSSEAPFKYRLLFPAIVKGTYALVYQDSSNQGFYYIYKLWSFVFYVTAVCAFFVLLKACGFRDSQCFYGSLIFLLLPAMLMAYTLPVHTREDTLAYTIFFLGLTALVRQQRLLFLLAAIAGVLCRETLLLLPLLYIFFAKDDKLLRRMFIAGTPAVVWISLRLIMGHETYDVLEGFHWNLDNPEQVVGFLFITFNVCWISFVFHLLHYRQDVNHKNHALSFFYRSSIVTLAVIMLTTFFGGIYNEIRLLYLFAPWMIIVLLDYANRYRMEIRGFLAGKRFLSFAILALVFCVALLYVFLKYQKQIIVPGKYNVPYHLWIIFSIVYIFIMLLALPLSIKILLLKKTDQ